jgi:hypothetical protein
MAVIWHFTASFASEEFARAFVEHFDKTLFPVPHAGLVEPRLGVEKNDSGWEVAVLPYVETPSGSHGGPWHLNGHGGATTSAEVEDIDACALVLYDRLRRIFNYRFALTGFEVGDWRSVGELVDDLSPGGLYEEHRRGGHRGFEGLVVSQNLYEAAESPPGFVGFSAGYLWVPFTSIANVQ